MRLLADKYQNQQNLDINQPKHAKTIPLQAHKY
ncbi:hypothetical protein BMETH_3088197259, partial [methanotrophic bacterial endosymbiont of Bathymodiolus sp.]